MSKIPNPGSRAAAAQGCTCSAPDNNWGRTAPIEPTSWLPLGAYYITQGCPVHDTRQAGDFADAPLAEPYYKDSEAEGIRQQADVIAEGMAAYHSTLSGQTIRGRYVLKRLLITVNKLRYQAWKIEKGIY